MRVVIAGAGNVGRSIGTELLQHGHDVLLIDKNPKPDRVAKMPHAQWREGDACEIAVLDDCDLGSYDVIVAATGDDKVNLVIALLAKTEYGVARVVARVNHPKNEWLFNEAWGVDVAVSTPRILTALVEEAVSVGDLVRLLHFQHGDAALVEVTLPEDAPVVGKAIGDVTLPADSALVAVLREGRVVVPTPDTPLEAGDEIFAIVADADVEAQLGRTLGSS
ncbi:MAG TPA: TrkA family potassium uptake protein [Mycobacteriales bacterium]|nr:TrkA family potassium uptake protein [Mycobacteriales bacterium]